MKNAGKQNETELEWIDKGNANEKYKGKENGNRKCYVTQNAARIKRFSKLHIVIKPLNKKKTQ